MCKTTDSAAHFFEVRQRAKLVTAAHFFEVRQRAKLEKAAHFFEVRQCAKLSQLLTSSKFANVQNYRLSCSLLRSSPRCKTTDSAAHFFEVRQCAKLERTFWNYDETQNERK